MKAYEKLARLTRFANRKALCDAAHLGPNALGQILSRRSDIRGRTAAALARVLCVDAGWLMDDSKGWPPVRVEEESEACTAA